MKVVHTNIDDYCRELKDDAAFVRDKIVRIRIDKTQDEEGPYWDIGMWATAVIDRKQDGTDSYILEFGEPCGQDREGKKTDGTEQAETWKQKIEDVADEMHMQARTGKREFI